MLFRSGQYKFTNQRDKIFLCTRNDGEKLYSDEELLVLKKQLQTLAPVFMGDTQGKENYKMIRSNLKFYIEREIEKYSHYKLTITDRYHGTIFSLIAGTPVIIIKTNDHKVVTGADWFKDVYEGSIFVAKDLNDAYRIAKGILSNYTYHNLPTYFENNFYGKVLKDLFDDTFIIEGIKYEK